MPKITVIMGIYNVESTLQKALDSVFAQTYQDFDMVLCDDGSQDRTFELASGYVERYPGRVTLLRNDRNMGLHYTLNRCLEHVTGEYTARMDGDDICTPDRFEKQAAFLDAHSEIAVVSSSIQFFDENGPFRFCRSVPYPTPVDLAFDRSFCHPASMLRTEAYRKVGGYRATRWTLRVEDTDLWFRLYAAGYRGFNFSEPLIHMLDDRAAAKRRKYRYRINAFLVRISGFYRLHVPWYCYPYALRPLLVGLLPRPIYLLLHRRKMKLK